MKILAISDEVVDWVYSAALRDRCVDVGMVIGCGDLPIWYLEFVASSLDVPCVYVHGNHDSFEIGREGVIKTSPAGWLNLDMHTQSISKVRMAGLEGCLRYKPDVPYQYTQLQQRLRGLALATKLFVPHVLRRRLDVMVSHAPLYGVHDGPDHAHTGFAAFNWLANVFQPRVWLHGHQHRNYAPRQPAETQLYNTRVINVHPYRIIEL